MDDLIQWAFGALIAVIAMPLIFSRLEDQPHPDEQQEFRRHRPSRVVRAAPEREDVTT